MYTDHSRQPSSRGQLHQYSRIVFYIGFGTVQESLSKYVSKTKSEGVVPYWDPEMGEQLESVQWVDFDD